MKPPPACRYRNGADPWRRHRAPGFTVPEVLLVLTVMVILAVLLYAATTVATQNTRKVASLATMRNIAAALARYTEENRVLPGPLHGGQNLVYSGTSYNLTTHLWPYLGIPTAPRAGDILPQYVPSHWIAWHQNTGREKTILYSMTPRVKPYDGGDEMNLWGYPASGEKGDPIREAGRYRTPWITLASSAPLGTTVIMTDTAQKNASETDRPKRGELQNYRTRLFLDWHADTVPWK
ncbi:MAG TPA: type II secretion system protein [Chthoniobacteraceae bacterium]|nr:type II secretion system protein [Chthoniobacteraceae bacterium]